MAKQSLITELITEKRLKKFPKETVVLWKDSSIFSGEHA